MSTQIELRLPRVEIDVPDLAAVAPSVAAHGRTDLASWWDTPERQASRSGLRTASIEIAVRLGGDALALAVAVAAVPSLELAQGILWVLGALVSFAATGLYVHRLRMSALDDLPVVLIGSAVGVAVSSLAGPGGLRYAVFAAVLGGLLVVLTRMVTYGVLRRWRSRGLLSRDAVLVGAGSRVSELVTRIEQHPETGLRVRGVLGANRMTLSGAPISGEVADLPFLIASGAVDTVIVGDASSEEERRVIEALRTCAGDWTEVFVLPRLPEFSRTCDDEIWGVPLQKLKQRRSRTEMAVKRIVDVGIATAALVAVGWLIGLAALAVRLEMGPGVIYRQERVGLNGRRFQLFKLRSMRPQPVGSTSEWAANEDRTGRVGAFIRRYSIDELPQLMNVLRGDMSVVGPRPERPEFVDQFGIEFPSYCYRHRAMVGLTGLAAVEGLRGDTSIAERAYFDNWYIEHWSLWLDIKIMVRTASALLNGTGR
jgi:exopolysaccharide biosynthesis polyprenyl glycosylphosphotransferase